MAQSGALRIETRIASSGARIRATRWLHPGYEAGLVIASQWIGAKCCPMTGFAKQSTYPLCGAMDCFADVRNDVEGALHMFLSLPLEGPCMEGFRRGRPTHHPRHCGISHCLRKRLWCGSGFAIGKFQFYKYIKGLAVVLSLWRAA
jgi:hypothetical protein